MHAPADFLDLNHTQHSILFPANEPVWAALTKIVSYLDFRLQREMRCSIPQGAFIGEDVFIDEGTTIEPGAVIKGPAWIGKNCMIRAGCYIRENVIVGNACVLGNSCEFKNCVIFDHCEVPHYNYVGDSVLGYKAHLGAGVVLSNVRLDRGEVTIADSKKPISTGLRKFGAIIGDHAEIGCNSVINPGSLIGRRSIIYPLSSFSGILPNDSILKTRQQQVIVKRTV
ncbi:transferase family hexapeptide repeat protein [Prosthecobacter fusiformis]|uniref:Transferase family hexapeptide repeat protein n=1 Tax=Prosthecobacter fusiformis TaxID=48464 RepID=A0A4R7RJN9_9BACT|nr:UDP-N-acetylglucosamine diphosphorylase [Prosthecobacter fusiformis]TDU63116.1 transferase family hexapeptide repeat protein [Prosthecobacter fusiformis]